MKCIRCGQKPKNSKDYENRLGLCTACYKFDRKVASDFKKSMTARKTASR